MKVVFAVVKMVGVFMLWLSMNCFIIVSLCYAKSLVHCWYHCSFLLFVLVSNFFLFSVRSIV